MIALRVRRQLTKRSGSPKNSNNSKGSYQTWTWPEYYKDSFKFACSLIKLGVEERSCVNLIGFNAPEWAIAFFGTIFANCIASGVYTTNGSEACIYQA